VAVAEKQRRGKSKEKGFPLRYTCVGRNMGRDMAYGAEAASPLTCENFGKFTALPMCAGQRSVKYQFCERSRHSSDLMILTRKKDSRDEVITSKAKGR
jgi:hypothetical protein